MPLEFIVWHLRWQIILLIKVNVMKHSSAVIRTFLIAHKVLSDVHQRNRVELVRDIGRLLSFIVKVKLLAKPLLLFRFNAFVVLKLVAGHAALLLVGHDLFDLEIVFLRVVGVHIFKAARVLIPARRIVLVFITVLVIV